MLTAQDVQTISEVSIWYTKAIPEEWEYVDEVALLSKI
jgi:hypothetical protein